MHIYSRRIVKYITKHDCVPRWMQKEHLVIQTEDKHRNVNHSIPIKSIGGVRFRNICKNNGIGTINDLSKYTKLQFLALKNCGRKTTSEAEQLLYEHGLYFGYLE